MESISQVITPNKRYKKTANLISVFSCISMSFLIIALAILLYSMDKYSYATLSPNQTSYTNWNAPILYLPLGIVVIPFLFISMKLPRLAIRSSMGSSRLFMIINSVITLGIGVYLTLYTAVMSIAESLLSSSNACSPGWPCGFVGWGPQPEAISIEVASWIACLIMIVVVIEMIRLAITLGKNGYLTMTTSIEYCKYIQERWEPAGRVSIAAIAEEFGVRPSVVISKLTSWMQHRLLSGQFDEGAKNIIFGRSDAKSHQKEIAEPREEQEHLDKLRKIIKVSNSLEIARLADLLKVDSQFVWDHIIDWAEQFGFRIEENKVIFGQGDTGAFLDELQRQFDTWDGKTKSKDGKI